MTVNNAQSHLKRQVQWEIIIVWIEPKSGGVAAVREVHLRSVFCQALLFPFLTHLCPDWASLVAQRLKRLPGMRETRVWSLGREDPLEKELATHSSTLAWRIPWREEPGRLQSMGLRRVRHDWATSLHFKETEQWKPEPRRGPSSHSANPFQREPKDEKRHSHTTWAKYPQESWNPLNKIPGSSPGTVSP